MAEREPMNTEPLDHMIDRLGVASVFGKPTGENGTVIIPVAQVEFGFGYGSGTGQSGEAVSAVQVTENGSDPGGSGGGGGGRSTPRGFIRISDEGVTYTSIVDEMRIPLAGILMVAWSVFWTMATIRAIAQAVASVKQARARG